MVKTNAMRLLEAAKISYQAKEYEVDETDLSGRAVPHRKNPHFSDSFL